MLQRDGERWIANGFTPAPLPEGVTVEIDEPPTRRADGYRDAVADFGRFRASARRRQMGSATFVGIVAVLFGVACSVVLGAALAEHGKLPIVAMVLAGSHGLIGLGLAWFALALWLNATVVEVGDGFACSKPGPIWVPFAPARPVALELVARFESEPSPNGTGAAWWVLAQTRSGTRVPVVAHLRDEVTARFFERRLNARLQGPPTT